MKLSKPILLKSFFQSFKDERGYLNELSLSKILDAENLKSFEPRYQLVSFTKNSGTFRGFHFQKPPSQQIKILALHQGSILDIVFPFDDLKKENIQQFNLIAGDILIIPDNFAHGFYTKSSDVLIQYTLNKDFVSADYRGFYGGKFIKKITKNDNVLISPKDLSLQEIEIFS